MYTLTDSMLVIRYVYLMVSYSQQIVSLMPNNVHGIIYNVLKERDDGSYTVVQAVASPAPVCIVWHKHPLWFV
jgi:hypothetical protein